ncbi:uncharacterized protein [Arachis hypogaea]|uniref:uncharacterized protein n=1 Tax=Arachis hypogaea TaxID=3818 RepID=UPI003B212031
MIASPSTGSSSKPMELGYESGASVGRPPDDVNSLIVWKNPNNGADSWDKSESRPQAQASAPTSNNAATWLLSAIYGSPQRPNRRSLWISLHSLAANINLPWCILGDFNALLHDYERQGSTHSANSEACSDFQSCISDCGLVDLGYMDWPFIWKRGDLVERLDRGLCNLDWQLAFPEASFKHLPNFRSDHTTIFLQLSTEASYNRHRRPFCFVAAWISHPEFHRSVENSWKVQDSWSDENMAFSFYADLYNDSLPDHPFVLNNAFPQLNAKDLYSVGRNIFELDIKEAIFHIGRFKYPGRDGLQAIFYQSQWDHLGPNLCSLVNQIFANPEKIEELNETLITLIPKTEQIRVLWNGEELDKFTPTRGIQQGGPIFSYIFVLCIERLSQLIGAAVQHGIKFLWGDSENFRKIHLINWDKVCSPKKLGGLGICHSGKINYAFMTKVGWGLIEKRDFLWTRTLHSKYGCGTDIIPKVERRRNESNLWKGIRKSWDNVQQNYIWRIEDGSKINFWNNNWVPNIGSLAPYANQVCMPINLKDKLMDFLTISDSWDYDRLATWLPDEISRRFCLFPRPPFGSKNTKLPGTLRLTALSISNQHTKS